MTAIGKSQLPKAAVLLFTNALGAALSVLLLVITGLLIFIYTRFAKIEDMEVV